MAEKTRGQETGMDPIWLNEVLDVYKTLPDSSRNEMLSALLQESSFSQLYFLQDNLQKLQHRDFMILLPVEIVEHLLTFLDLKTLYTCCQVSRHWNSVITSCFSIWQRKFKTMGLRITSETKNAVTDNTETYKSLCLRMTKKMRQMRTRRGFRTETYQGSSKRVTAVYFWKNKLASGTDDGSIFIWNSENDTVINQHKMSDDFCITCLSMDDQMLVVGSSNGFLASLALDMFQHKHIFGQFSAAVFSIDFSSELNLVVSGSADNTIKLWSLSLGRLICTLHAHTHWVLKVILKPLSQSSEVIYNAPNAYLVSMDKEKILLWPLDKDITSVPRPVASIPLLSCPHGFFTPGLHFHDHFLYFIQQNLDVKSSTTLCKYDIFTKKTVHELKLNLHVKILQAIGSKYVCIITRQCDFPNLLILDLETLKEVALLHLPLSRTITPDQPHITFGDTNWLDGLDGFNNMGMVLAIGLENGTITVFKWKN